MESFQPLRMPDEGRNEAARGSRRALESRSLVRGCLVLQNCAQCNTPRTHQHLAGLSGSKVLYQTCIPKGDAGRIKQREREKKNKARGRERAHVSG